MIVLGAVVPHPPILLPQIAQGREVHAQATLDAYAVVANRLRDLKVERLLMISTHGIVTLNRFHILTSDLEGDFERFGHAGLTFTQGIDGELVERIADSAAVSGVSLTRTGIWEQSDHSVGVPITLLGDALPESIAIASISFRPPGDHYQFGEAIGQALATIPEPTAVIASGDAVHRLNDASPRGRHPQGEQVQQDFERAFGEWDHESLIEMDQSIRHDVDESVISPTLILMGALGPRGVDPHILCSEHPWGVGYVTALAELTRDRH